MIKVTPTRIADLSLHVTAASPDLSEYSLAGCPPLAGATPTRARSAKRRFTILAMLALGLTMLTAPERALAQRPIGIDVSDYQSAGINWGTLKNTYGISFGWAKISEGTGVGAGYGGGNFTTYAANAKAAGVLIGAYHYARYDLNLGTAGATAEARAFWSGAKNYLVSGGYYIQPMLDVEASFSSYTKTTLSQWVNQWCLTVSNNAAAAGVPGIKPCIYCSSSHASAYLDSTVTQWNNDIADWAYAHSTAESQAQAASGPPAGIAPWSTWQFWQYDDQNVAQAYTTGDGDIFNGTLAQLGSTMVIGGGDGAAVASSSVPGGVLPGQTFTATITMNNSGSSSWTNNGAKPYRLGSQSAQDNTTWGFNRVSLPASPISSGQNAAFTFTATAPSTPGTYTFAWQMVEEGVHWFGEIFTTTIIVGNGASVVSSSIPSTVTIGQSFTATITLKNTGGTAWTNNSAIPYELGSQSPQGNATWGTNRVVLPASPINPGQNAAFIFAATAPATIGTYTFAWRMLEEPGTYFGATFTTTIAVVLSGPGTNYGSYTIDTGNMDSTSRNGSYVNYSACGVNAWYSYVCNTAGTYFDRDIRWMPPLPTYGFAGRGYLSASALVPDTRAEASSRFTALDASGNDLAGPLTGAINQCAYSCTSPTFFAGTVNLSSFGGFRSNTKDDAAGSGCNSTCGSFRAGYSQMHIQAARWQYIDDWTCVGGYASASVSDTSNRSFNEASLYLYPAVDASHGNVITAALGLNGQTPGRVTTGDCNNANTLDFKGNANAFGGGDNMDAYGFAWIFTPAGAGPQIVIGSDDGNRLWVNGALKNDNNASRSLTRDQDNTGAVTLPAGWSRVLLKIHNFTAGFQSTVSLRNGGNVNLNEPSVNYYDLGGYYSYGLGYEQDAWYPQIVVSNVYGVINPVNGAAFYGNNTTVAASGASNGQGPVPYWRTMQYQWGNDLGNADSNYADVSGTPTSASWSHSTSGVAGHRRFHFFAVSQSGRTSFQNSGIIGGSRFQDAGNYARYYDIYVDNVAPVNPSFSSVSAASTTQINLGWVLPLDQGVNVAPGSTESAGGTGNLDSQNWYRVGDVGCQLYRNGSLLSAWGTGASFNDTGLVANTAYTYTLEARDNNTGTRGNWHNTTGQQGSTTGWTLSVPPIADSVTASPTTNVLAGQNVTWTAVNGFGAGLVQYYRYAWDTLASHTWTDTEPQWLAGTLSTIPPSGGTWYLHVKGYNGGDIGNGTFDYAVAVTSAAPTVTGIGMLKDGNVHLGFTGGAEQTYLIQAADDLTPPITWTTISTNTADGGGYFGLDDLTATNHDYRFYRAATP